MKTLLISAALWLATQVLIILAFRELQKFNSKIQ